MRYIRIPQGKGAQRCAVRGDAMPKRNYARQEDVEGVCPSYTIVRDDIIELIPAVARRVLDIGCSTGLLGRTLKKRVPDIEVVGIEINPVAAAVARKSLDRVIEGNAEEVDLGRSGISPGYFDVIVYGDVLEHCRDPWETLKRHRPFHSSAGRVVVSLPNAQFWSVPLNLLLGNWGLADRGVHDRTHLRFFTLKTMLAMFESTGYRIVKMRRNYRILERVVRGNRILGTTAAYVLYPFRNLFTFQYVFLLKPGEYALPENES